jgi:hypothetical protein
MANKKLTIKEIKSIYNVSIERYKENMQKEGRSKLPEYFADRLMFEYENAIVENGIVVAYYNSGVKALPKFPKYAL